MYLNSSNIHEEKTEEITTVKKTCITDTNREVMTSQKTKFAKLWDSSRKDKMKNPLAKNQPVSANCGDIRTVMRQGFV